jgi:hypothetical protein
LPHKNLLMGKKQIVFNDVGVNASYSGSLLWKNHVFFEVPFIQMNTKTKKLYYEKNKVIMYW